MLSLQAEKHEPGFYLICLLSPVGYKNGLVKRAKLYKFDVIDVTPHFNALKTQRLHEARMVICPQVRRSHVDR